MKNIGISYGVLAETIKEQLDSQGFKYDNDKVNQFERQREAINTLSFGFILNDSSIDRAFKKLHRNICNHVSKENHMKVKVNKETSHRKI